MKKNSVVFKRLILPIALIAIVMFAIIAILLEPYKAYLFLHILVILLSLGLAVLALASRPSRGQNAVILFMLAAAIYIFGFVLQILASTIEGYYLACCTQYFGEMIVFIGLIFYVSVLCRKRIPWWVYTFQVIISALVVYALISTRENHFFYREISISNEGPFPRLKLTYGPGFFIAISYIAILSTAMLVIVIVHAFKSKGNERKRCLCSIAAIISCWLPYLLQIMGLTGGYEIPGVGMVLAAFWLMLVLRRYGFLDSVTLAGEKVIASNAYGIMVMDDDYRLVYCNRTMEQIVGRIAENVDLRKNPKVRNIIEGRSETLKFNDRIYDIRFDELSEKNSNSGYMLWLIDNTEHYRAVDLIMENAEKDPLTKLFNRDAFHERLINQLGASNGGTFIMVDVDNFKQVNDRFGHKRGDEVLLLLAGIFKEFDEDSFLSCRIGGDEFAAFVPNVTDKEAVGRLIGDVANRFNTKLREIGCERITGLSIGALVCTPDQALQADFDTFYSGADELLYRVKENGKGNFLIGDLSLNIRHK